MEKDEIPISHDLYYGPANIYNWDEVGFLLKN